MAESRIVFRRKEEIIESQGRKQHRQDARPLPAVKGAHHDGEEETRGRRLQGDGQGQRKTTRNYRNPIAPSFGENPHVPPVRGPRAPVHRPRRTASFPLWCQILSPFGPKYLFRCDCLLAGQITLPLKPRQICHVPPPSNLTSSTLASILRRKMSTSFSLVSPTRQP